MSFHSVGQQQLLALLILREHLISARHLNGTPVFPQLLGVTNNLISPHVNVNGSSFARNSRPMMPRHMQYQNDNFNSCATNYQQYIESQEYYSRLQPPPPPPPPPPAASPAVTDNNMYRGRGNWQQQRHIFSHSRDSRFRRRRSHLDDIYLPNYEDEYTVDDYPEHDNLNDKTRDRIYHRKSSDWPNSSRFRDRRPSFKVVPRNANRNSSHVWPEKPTSTSQEKCGSDNNTTEGEINELVESVNDTQSKTCINSNPNSIDSTIESVDIAKSVCDDKNKCDTKESKNVIETKTDYNSTQNVIGSSATTIISDRPEINKEITNLESADSAKINSDSSTKVDVNANVDSTTATECHNAIKNKKTDCELDVSTAAMEDKRVVNTSSTSDGIDLNSEPCKTPELVENVPLTKPNLFAGSPAISLTLSPVPKPKNSNPTQNSSPLSKPSTPAWRSMLEEAKGVTNVTELDPDAENILCLDGFITIDNIDTTQTFLISDNPLLDDYRVVDMDMESTPSPIKRKSEDGCNIVPTKRKKIDLYTDINSDDILNQIDDVLNENNQICGTSTRKKKIRSKSLTLEERPPEGNTISKYNSEQGVSQLPVGFHFDLKANLLLLLANYKEVKTDPSDSVEHLLNTFKKIKNESCVKQKPLENTNPCSETAIKGTDKKIVDEKKAMHDSGNRRTDPRIKIISDCSLKGNININTSSATNLQPTEGKPQRHQEKSNIHNRIKREKEAAEGESKKRVADISLHTSSEKQIKCNVSSEKTESKHRSTTVTECKQPSEISAKFPPPKIDLGVATDENYRIRRISHPKVNELLMKKMDKLFGSDHDLEPKSKTAFHEFNRNKLSEKRRNSVPDSENHKNRNEGLGKTDKSSHQPETVRKIDKSRRTSVPASLSGCSTIYTEGKVKRSTPRDIDLKTTNESKDKKELHKKESQKYKKADSKSKQLTDPKSLSGKATSQVIKCNYSGKAEKCDKVNDIPKTTAKSSKETSDSSDNATAVNKDNPNDKMSLNEYPLYTKNTNSQNNSNDSKKPKHNKESSSKVDKYTSLNNIITATSDNKNVKSSTSKCSDPVNRGDNNGKKEQCNKISTILGSNPDKLGSGIKGDGATNKSTEVGRDNIKSKSESATKVPRYENLSKGKHTSFVSKCRGDVSNDSRVKNMPEKDTRNSDSNRRNSVNQGNDATNKDTSSIQTAPVANDNHPKDSVGKPIECTSSNALHNKVDTTDAATSSKASTKMMNFALISEVSFIKCGVLYQERFPVRQKGRHAVVENECCDRSVILDSPEIVDNVTVVKQDTVKVTESHDVVEIKPETPVIDLTEDEVEVKEEDNKDDLNMAIDLTLSEKNVSSEGITLYRSEETLNSRLDVQAMVASISPIGLRKPGDDVEIKIDEPEIVSQRPNGGSTTPNLPQTISTGITPIIAVPNEGGVANICKQSGSHSGTITTSNNPPILEGPATFQNTWKNFTFSYVDNAVNEAIKQREVQLAGIAKSKPNASSHIVQMLRNIRPAKATVVQTTQPAMTPKITPPEVSVRIANTNDRPQVRPSTSSGGLHNTFVKPPPPPYPSVTIGPMKSRNGIQCQLIQTQSAPDNEHHTLMKVPHSPRRTEDVGSNSSLLSPNERGSQNVIEDLRSFAANQTPRRIDEGNIPFGMLQPAEFLGSPRRVENNSTQFSNGSGNGIPSREKDYTQGQGFTTQTPSGVNNTQGQNTLNCGRAAPGMNVDGVQGMPALTASDALGPEMIRLGTTLIRYLCFFDALRKAQMAYIEELKKSLPFLPIAIQKELKRFEDENSKKFYALSRNMMIDLNRINLTSVAEDGRKAQILIQSIFISLKRVIQTLTPTWIYLMLEALMQPEMMGYISVPFLRGLYNVVGLTTMKIRQSAAVPSSGVAREAISPEQINLLRWQIIQYKEILKRSQLQRDPLSTSSSSSNRSSPRRNSGPFVQNAEAMRSAQISLPRNIPEPAYQNTSTLMALLREPSGSNIKVHSNIRLASNLQTIDADSRQPRRERNSDVVQREPAVQQSDNFKIRLPFTLPYDMVHSSSTTTTSPIPNQNLHSPAARRMMINSPARSPIRQNIAPLLEKLVPDLTRPEPVYAPIIFTYRQFPSPSSKRVDQPTACSSTTVSTTNAPPANRANSTVPANIAISTATANSATSMAPANDATSTAPANSAISAAPANSAISTPPDNSAISTPPANSAFSTPPDNSAISTPPANSTVSTPSTNSANSTPSINSAIFTPTNSALQNKDGGGEAISPQEVKAYPDLTIVKDEMNDENEVVTIDLTWMDDIDPQQIQNEIYCIAIKKEEPTDEDENEAYEEMEENDPNIVTPSPADSGISSPPAQVEYNEQVFLDRTCICGKSADYVCGCMMAMYCSEPCQARDWRTHREMCHKHNIKNKESPRSQTDDDSASNDS